MNNFDKKERLEEIAKQIKTCTRCKLHLYRRNPVPGEGSPESGIVFIGEAPGAQEDIQGRPFVGAAGKVLNELLEDIGLERKDVYITNVVKCRPPNNRDPTQDEIKKCSYFLDRQLEIIKPKIIITLGRHSTRYLFSKIGKNFESILKIHGKIIRVSLYGSMVTIFPTLHPAAALYNPRMKKILESDFRKIKDLISTILEDRSKNHNTLDKYFLI